VPDASAWPQLEYVLIQGTPNEFEKESLLAAALNASGGGYATSFFYWFQQKIRRIVLLDLKIKQCPHLSAAEGGKAKRAAVDILAHPPLFK
jgi:hypothetical protein